MPASKRDIAEWFDHGVEEGATHMLVVVDTFDFDDYPVFVAYGEDPEAKVEEYNAKEMQRVMEVYDLSIDRHVQLAVSLCWNTGPAPVRGDA